MPPTPRTATWPGFPRAAGIDDYEPREHAERAAAHLAAVGNGEGWPIPLTRCGEPAQVDLWQQVLTARRRARRPAVTSSPIGQALLDVVDRATA